MIHYPKIALVFPGQGSQFVGMGKELISQYPYVQHLIEEANDALNFDIAKLMFEGPQEALIMTYNAQPALLLTGYIAFTILSTETGIIPFIAAGHSLGEITALTASGAVKFSDAMKLVHKRGVFMQQAVNEVKTGMSAVIGLPFEKVDHVCKDISTNDSFVTVSNINSPLQSVISGHAVAIGKASEIFAESGVKVIPLKVSAPFHSPLMNEAAKEFEDYIEHINVFPLKFPVLSNVTAKPYHSEKSIKHLLTEQITQPVQWRNCMNYIEQLHCDAVIEASPGRTLSGFFNKSNYTGNIFAMDLIPDLQYLSDKLNKTTQYRPGSYLLKYSVSVVNKGSNTDENELKQSIEEMKRVSEQLDTNPTDVDKQAAYELLKKILRLKKCSEEEYQLIIDTAHKILFRKYF